MSSDFFVSKSDLEDAGVILIQETCPVMHEPMTTATFPGWPHKRDVYVALQPASNQVEVQITCSGRFREWLKDSFLIPLKVAFEEF